jgi:hypothetical protein
MDITNAIVARAKNFAGLDSVPMFLPVISAFLWSELIIIQHQAADTESRHAKKNDTFAQQQFHSRILQVLFPGYPSMVKCQIQGMSA